MKISEFIQKYDPSDQFNVLIKTYEQVEFAWNNQLKLDHVKRSKKKSVVVTGMGGSAISGDLMQNYLLDELNLPFMVNRSYSLPPFLNKNTLLIVSSYSGNTEETLSVFNSALKQKCRMVCITTGGKLEKLATKNKIPVVKILAGFHPRYALGLSFFSLLNILQKLKLIPNQDSIVKTIIKLLKEKGAYYSTQNNIAINYAEQILGYIPVIYSAVDITSAIGYRFKCQFNENSKLHAFHNTLPEANHNEVIGWETSTESQFRTRLINILDKTYHPQIKKRFRITSELITENRAEVINLESSEKKLKVRLMDLIYLCDWITYYTAILRGYDPAEIKNIDLLKEKLSN
jgi:glucose/mannose-6-phosphate isomerase